MNDSNMNYTTETTIMIPHVYSAISTVVASMAKRGIGKNRTADTGARGTYQFRGIDDFYNALAPELATAKLCILPRCTDRNVVERQSSKGNALFYVTVTMEFDFISAEDGSKHTVGPFYGEAMDSGDKATNKAMSAAYKYCVMQAFAIPVEGRAVDSERDMHEVLTDALTVEQIDTLTNMLDEQTSLADLRTRTAAALKACRGDKDAHASVKAYAVGLAELYAQAAA